MTREKLDRIYKKLYRSLGRQYWWPAKTKLEVVVGAVLTQNTSWSNVERAISNLAKNNTLSFNKLYNLKIKKLARLIKPAGYFNIKARRLKNLLQFMNKNYQGSLRKMRREDTYKLREELLSVNGIGQETADSILLYALDKPIFVVDAYTKRIFSHLNIVAPDAPYEQIQKLFMDNLSADSGLFNEYHALLVRLGKDYCKKQRPLCQKCPIRDEH
jgi:endonuclease-3 related protein